MNKVRFKGIVLVIFGSTLWGVSATVAQFLFKQNNFTASYVYMIP